MELAVVFLGASLGGIVQTVTGFGGGVVMMMFLPYFFDMLVAPGLSSAICIGVTFALAWKFRKYVDFKKILLPAAAYVPCSFFIIRSVKGMDLNLLTLVFGIFLVVLSIYFFVFSKRVHFEATPLSGLLCGAFSGVTSGLFGIGGPLMAIYFLSATESKEEYSGTIQGLFTITATINLLLRISQGIYTLDLVPLTLVGVVSINLGKWVGLKIVKRLNADLLRKLIYAFVGISGVITIFKCL